MAQSIDKNLTITKTKINDLKQKLENAISNGEIKLAKKLEEEIINICDDAILCSNVDILMLYEKRQKQVS